MKKLKATLVHPDMSGHIDSEILVPILDVAFSKPENVRKMGCPPYDIGW